MADKEIGLRIRVKGTTKQEQELNRLQTSMDRLVKERKDLNKAVKDGIVSERQATIQRRRLNTDLKATKNRFNDLERTVLKNNDALRKNSGFVNGVRAGVTQAVGVIGGAIAALRGFIAVVVDLNSTAVQIEQWQRRASVVFGEYVTQIKAVGDQTATSLGLTTNEFLAATAAIGDLLVPIGFTRKASADMSSELVEVAAAIKDFSGDQRDTSEIASIVARSLTGETEGLKSLGVVVSQNTTEFKQLVKEKKAEFNASEDQAKALAIYQTILNKSTDAQDAFKDSTKSLAVQQAELAAEYREQKELLSEFLKPAFEAIGEQFSLNKLIPYSDALVQLQRNVNDLTGTSSKLGLRALEKQFIRQRSEMILLEKQGETTSRQYKILTTAIKLTEASIRNAKKAEGEGLFTTDTGIPLDEQKKNFEKFVKFLDDKKEQADKRRKARFATFAKEQKAIVDEAKDIAAADREQEELDNEAWIEIRKGFNQNLTETEINAQNIIQKKRREVHRERLKNDEEYKAFYTQFNEDILSSASNLFGSISALLGNQSQEAKAFALLQIGTNSAIAISRGVAASQSVPFPFNIPALLTTLTAVASGLAQARQTIEAEDGALVPKAQRGGIIQGPRHSQGGVKVNVGGRAAIEAEGGEPILTRGVGNNPQLLSMASAINVAGGGRPLTKAANGALTPSGLGLDGVTAFAQGVGQTRMNRSIKVKNVVTDTKREINKVDNITSSVTFGS